MDNRPQPDPEKATRFLEWLNSSASLYIESMASAGAANPIARHFSTDGLSEAISFVSTGNAPLEQRNMYFLPNAEFLDGKRKKENLAFARFLHVDLDNKDYPGTEGEQQDRILALLLDRKVRPKGVPHPSAVWFTGGGYQAVWRLAEPLAVEAAEELNLAVLMAMSGGSGTHNADRLLRLPWTTNWLNDKKRAAGRKPATAYHLHPFDFGQPPRAYSRADFSLRLPRRDGSSLAPSSRMQRVERLESLPFPEDLMEILPSEPKWVEVIVSGQNPRDHDYASRSELVFATAVWLLGRGVLPGHVLSILTAPDLGISAHVLESPNPLKYAQRQVMRAMDIVEARGGDWPVLNEKFRPIPSHPKNVRHALSRLAVDAQRNLFTKADEFKGAGLDGRDLNDIAEILCSRFVHDLDFVAVPAAIKRELLAISHENPYHPVVDYLDGLEWDGTPRIDTWLATYCGVVDSELNREFASKLLIAGVRRIKQPGVKFDTMLVLEGSQGAGKSRLAQLLAVRPEWFCGSLDLTSDDKTKAELLARAWIVECQELEGLNKSTSQNLKRFLSTPTDTFRRAYSRDAGEYHRHCIILGTTNEGAYLRDLTGNRRIWPVLVKHINLAGFGADVNQLWAEAVVREAAGEAITLSQHLWAAAAELQGQRMVEDAYADVLGDNFGEVVGRVSMDSVKLLLGLDTARMSSTDTRRIKAVMAGLGWEHGAHRLHDLGRGEKIQRKGFARGSPDERKVEFIARRSEGGVVLIDCLGPQWDKEPPF